VKTLESIRLELIRFHQL